MFNRHHNLQRLVEIITCSTSDSIVLTGFAPGPWPPQVSACLGPREEDDEEEDDEPPVVTFQVINNLTMNAISDVREQLPCRPTAGYAIIEGRATRHVYGI